MPPAERGAVKLAVRRAALRLERFTAEQVSEETGLNHSSVQTEIQRMLDAGLLDREPAAPAAAQNVRQAVYLVSSERHKRLELASSVSRFADGEPLPVVPNTTYFRQATELIQRAWHRDSRDRDALLAEASELLEKALYAQGGGLAPETLRARIAYERARLHLLAGRYDQAHELFAALEPAFLRLRDDARSRLCGEYRYVAANPDLAAGDRRAVIDAAGEMLSESASAASPLTHLFAEALIKAQAAVRPSRPAVGAPSSAWVSLPEPRRNPDRLRSGLGNRHVVVVTGATAGLSDW